MKALDDANDLFGMDVGVFVDEKKPEKSDKKPSLIGSIVWGNQIKVKQIEHIVEPTFAKGSIVVFGGRESCGKSTIASQLCVNVARGEMTMFDNPETFKGRKPMRTLYIDKEEPSDIVERRFDAMGANENLAFLTKENPLLSMLSTDSAELEEIFKAVKPELAVLAPFHSFLPRTRCNENSKKDMCQAVLPLIQLAEKYKCCIVLVVHTIKAENPDYRKCLAGSSYLSEAPRTVFMVHRPDMSSPTVYVSCEKASLVSVYEPVQTRILRFRRDDKGFDIIGQTTKKWRELILEAQGNDDAARTVATQRAERKTKLSETKRIIIETLENNGDMLNKDFRNAILEQGATTGTVDRAIRELKADNVIESSDVWQGHDRITTYRLVDTEFQVQKEQSYEKGGKLYDCTA